MRRILQCFGVIVLCMRFVPAYSQHEATMYFMNCLPQVSYLNPASVPNYKFSLGLPGSSVFALYGNNGFAYNDFAIKEDDVVNADLNKLYNAMADKNYISIAAQADLLRVSLKVNPRIYLTFNTTAKTYHSMMVPDEVTGLFINGTVAYVNGAASLAPRVENVVYIETAMGSSYIVNKKLTLGIRVKMLKGIANITTKSAEVNMAIDDEYVITARADADIRSSGIKNLIDYEDNTDEDWTQYLEDHWEDYLHNNGVAVDLGMTWQVTDRLKAGASLLDVGAITWKNDRYGYTLNPEQANYTFRGFDLERILDDDDDYIDAQLDTIEQRFTFEEKRIGAYRSALPAKMYLSGQYTLRDNLYIGMLLFAERFNARFATGVSVSLNKDFGRWVSTALSYTVTDRSFNNIGAGLSLNFAPFQLYIVGDNLLRAPVALLAEGELNTFANSMQHFNLRAGLNFVFGWEKTQERQPRPPRTR